MAAKPRNQNGKNRVPKPTLAAVIASELRERIVSGKITPGTQMNEVDLATRFASSRGPIREGMQRLVYEGLLVSIPHRGLFVPELTAEDLEDLYFARAAVERAAMLRLTAKGVPAAVIAKLDQELGEMEMALAEEDGGAVAAADLRFHEVIVAAAGSPRLEQMYSTLLGQTRLGLNLLLGTYTNRAELLDEHRALLRALVSEDPNRLLHVLDDHFNAALHNLGAAWSRRGDTAARDNRELAAGE